MINFIIMNIVIMIFLVSNVFGQNDSTKIDNWSKYQDSLRNEILKAKDNEIIKNSFLQEFYIRNIVKIGKDSLFFKIPFDLHSLDCGISDCYTTEITFSFRFIDSLIFPKKLYIKEHEFGCIEKENKISEYFILTEQTENLVIYFSMELNRTLVLLRSNKNTGTVACYFVNGNQTKINKTNILSILELKDENFNENNFPIRSWILTTNEYENFDK